MDQIKQQVPISEEDKKDIEENKSIALLNYLGPLCLIPILTKKDSKFVKFHSKQGLVLLIGWFFAMIPFFGWMLGFVLVFLSILGITNVLAGKFEKLPVIGDLAEKFNI